MRWGWRPPRVDPKAEQIKWWDIIDLIKHHNLESLVETTSAWFPREHGEGRWLYECLFATEESVTLELLRERMLVQEDDPRAMFVAAFAWDPETVVDGDEWEDRYDNGTAMLLTAAEMGYAPAQAAMTFRDEVEPEESFAWAQKAAGLGDRHGLSMLARSYEEGYGCEKDVNKAMQLYSQAAEVEDQVGLFKHGNFSFGEDDWRRYTFMGRSAARGHRPGYESLVRASFEKRDRRIQFEIGAAHKRVAAAWRFGRGLCSDLQLAAYQTVLVKYTKCCIAAKAAVACWLVVGRRLRVVKDIRGVIGKMLWAQRWEWMEEDAPAAPEEDAAKRPRVE
jgi:hypothetical protein